MLKLPTGLTTVGDRIKFTWEICC